MSYESRIIIAQKFSTKRNDGTEYTSTVWLAEMNLSRVDNPILNSFDKTIDWQEFDHYNDETEITYDRYGDKIRYTDDIQRLIARLEQYKGDYYRRYHPAAAMLKAYLAEKWDWPLIVMHYGY